MNTKTVTVLVGIALGVALVGGVGTAALASGPWQKHGSAQEAMAGHMSDGGHMSGHGDMMHGDMSDEEHEAMHESCHRGNPTDDSEGDLRGRQCDRATAAEREVDERETPLCHSDSAPNSEETYW